MAFFPFQIDSGDQQPWAFGDAAVFEENPFSGEGKNVSWMASDFTFETEGTEKSTYCNDSI